VFIVTDRTIVESHTTPTEETATGWPDAGGDSLPSGMARTPRPKSVKVTAFIYEFLDSTANNVSQFTLLDQSTIAATKSCWTRNNIFAALYGTAPTPTRQHRACWGPRLKAMPLHVSVPDRRVRWN